MSGSELNFYNGGDLSYTIDRQDIKTPEDDVSRHSVSLRNCDIKNQDFTVSLELIEQGKRIKIDAVINLDYVNNWMSKVKEQDELLYDNYSRVIQSIKEKFRLQNVLSDSEIDELEKEKDDAVLKYDIARKDFESRYCGEFHEWHRCGLYDRWGKYDNVNYMNSYENVGTLARKVTILKSKFENECNKRAVKYGLYPVDEDTIDWYGDCW